MFFELKRNLIDSYMQVKQMLVEIFDGLRHWYLAKIIHFIIEFKIYLGDEKRGKSVNNSNLCMCTVCSFEP